MVILIPMAGAGKRFREAGYEKPKPLIDVCGEPMIDRVVRNLRWIGRLSQRQKLVLVAQESVAQNLTHLLREGDAIVGLDQPTRGAVDTILKAVSYIDPEDSLLIGNCDQLLFQTPTYIQGSDGCVVTFPSQNPAHSYVTTWELGTIQDIAEKRVISEIAVAGVYYFYRAAQFVAAARQVIEQDTRYNGEFYVSSVIEKMITAGCIIGTYHVEERYKHLDIHMLGTPEQLQEFERKVRDGEVRLP